MADMFPDIWTGPQTSLFPYGLGASKAQAGSDGVANFVAAPYNNGSITYVEFGYAKERRFPVVSVLNQAGYFTQPTAQNVAIALQRAHINPDRTQVLHDVYRNPDPNTYPVSSYSYMIVPTSTAAGFTPGKGETLGRFILYFLCTGQQKADLLGYSPLPKNLVQFAFDAEKLIPGAPAPPPIAQCANPTITGGFTIVHAAPNPGNKAGSAPPPLPGGGGNGGGSGGNGAVTLSDLNNRSSNKNTTATTVAGAKSSTRGNSTGTDTGTGSDDGTSDQSAEDLATAPISVSAPSNDGVTNAVYVLVGLVVLAGVFLPPTIALAMRRRRA
jgi:hypothetical protein